RYLNSQPAPSQDHLELLGIDSTPKVFNEGAAGIYFGSFKNGSATLGNASSLGMAKLNSILDGNLSRHSPSRANHATSLDDFSLLLVIQPEHPKDPSSS
ncbi:hypothetical protein ACH5RR_012278, partial [Cinchona calisaya]